MADFQMSTKRVQIDNANLVIVASISVAVFLFVFSTFACKALLSQRSYQAKVITQKERAKKQLDENLQVVDTLITSYKEFAAQPENVIGGTANGTGDKDGDNAKIILDALPSKYDFPALATSLEKLSADKGMKINSITGVDDEVAQTGSSSTTAVDVPFEVSVEGSYQATQELIGVFEKSIRPFTINSLTFTSSKDGAITTAIKAKTYYQPEKVLQIKSEVVK